MERSEIAVPESVAKGVNAIYQAGFAAGEKHAQACPRCVGAVTGGAGAHRGVGLIIAGLLGVAFVGGAIFQEHQSAIQVEEKAP